MQRSAFPASVSAQKAGDALKNDDDRYTAFFSQALTVKENTASELSGIQHRALRESDTSENETASENVRSETPFFSALLTIASQSVRSSSFIGSGTRISPMR